jgi:hypothetical protein
MGQALPFKPVRSMGDLRFDMGYGGRQDLPWVTTLRPMESGHNLRRRFEVIGSAQATRQNVMTRSWFTVQSLQFTEKSRCHRLTVWTVNHEPLQRSFVLQKA